MVVGARIPSKFYCYLTNVEVVGLVHNVTEASFDIEPDANYRHLISYMRGNNPLPWLSQTSPGLLHCEDYVPDPSQVWGETFSWSLPSKPSGLYQVKLPGGGTRDLRAGDRVRVVGNWVVDHHPEYCSRPETFNPPEPSRCRNRGWLRVGIVHAELHPFKWDDIRLVEEPPPTGTRSLTLSLAAAIYEEQYLGSWKWFANEIAGVAQCIFIDDDRSNFHEAVRVTVTIPAPSIPASWAGVWRELILKETVILDRMVGPESTSRGSITKSDSVEITASVISRHGQWDTLGPGGPRFQARYDVSWKLVGAQISCINKGIRNSPRDHIDAVGGLLPDGSRWRISLVEAIKLVKRGHSFYVEDQGTDRVPVEIARSRFGNEYLKTVADYYEPNNLLRLPECPQ